MFFVTVTAIPKTPLYARLMAAGRLDLADDPVGGTNVLPLNMSREALSDGYAGGGDVANADRRRHQQQPPDRLAERLRVLRTVLGLNEAVTLCGVEPLHGSNSHSSSFEIEIAAARW